MTHKGREPDGTWPAGPPAIAEDQQQPAGGPPGLLARRWVQLSAVGVLALLVGTGIGRSSEATSAASTQTTSIAASPAVGLTAADLGAARDRATAAEQEAATARSDRQTLTKERVTALSDRDAARKEAADLKAAAAAPPASPPPAPAPAPDPAPVTTIEGTGTFLVPGEVAPGTYRSTSSSTCYYARLSGTSGGLSDIITNDLGTGQKIVTIAKTDAAFETSRCGTWTKIK